MELVEPHVEAVGLHILEARVEDYFGGSVGNTRPLRCATGSAWAIPVPDNKTERRISILFMGLNKNLFAIRINDIIINNVFSMI